MINSDWKNFKLGEVSQLVGGGTPSRKVSEYFGKGYEWVTPTDLLPIGQVSELGKVKEQITEKGLNHSSARLLPKGTVLYSSRATVGKIALTNRECTTNQGFANFIPKADVLDSWFLAYYLCYTNSDILYLAGETTYKEISKAKLAEFPISLPPLEEQRRIVGRIKECLSRVDEIKQLREESRKEARVLEEATFGDFLEDAQRDGCKVVTVGDVLTKAQYGTSSKASLDETGIPILRMGNIKSGHFDFNRLKYIKLSDVELAKYRLNKGDILINRTNSMELVGKAAVFPEKEGNWVFASYLVRLIVDSSKAIPEFVNASINSRIGRAYVYATARRAIGMVNINAKEIAKMPLPLPSLEKQEQIVTRISEARNASQSLLEELEIKAIELLPNSILRKAFAGEL